MLEFVSENTIEAFDNVDDAKKFLRELVGLRLWWNGDEGYVVTKNLKQAIEIGGEDDWVELDSDSILGQWYLSKPVKTPSNAFVYYSGVDDGWFVRAKCRDWAEFNGEGVLGVTL